MTPHTAKRSEKRYHYYRCHRGAEYRRGSCKQRMRRAEEAEEAMWGFVSRIMKDPGRILLGMDALIEQKRAETRGDPEREARAWLVRLAEVDQERRGYLRLAATGRMSEAELDGALAELEEARQTAERELEAAGSRREEIEQLERDRDALRASWSAAVPDNLDRLTPEGRNTLYHKLRLEMRPQGEGGYEVTGPFCASEPLPS
jgi:recombinase-like zinc beta ribbon protein